MATSISSGLKTADALIATGRNRINGIILNGDGTNAASVVIYDNTAASGKVVDKVVLGAGHVHGDQHIFTNPILCEHGIYADVTGPGAEYVVFYGG